MRSHVTVSRGTFSLPPLMTFMRRLLTRGEAMSAQTPIAFLGRRGFFIAVFAVAACDSDPTPIVRDDGQSLSLAPTNTPGGGPGSIGAVPPSSDPGYKLGANDRLRITVFGQPTLTGEYTVDG